MITGTHTCDIIEELPGAKVLETWHGPGDDEEIAVIDLGMRLRYRRVLAQNAHYNIDANELPSLQDHNVLHYVTAMYGMRFYKPKCSREA